MTSPTRADWYDDPFERFEQRYHDGTRWTKKVSSAGVEITDPTPIPRIKAEPTSSVSETAGVEPTSLSMTDEKRRQLGFVTVGCGAAIVLAAFMTWGSSRSDSVTGLGMKVGYVTAFFGVIIALYGWQAFQQGVIRRHRSTLWAIILTTMVAGLASSLFEELDEATFGSQEVEVGNGILVTFFAALLAIWPWIMFRRDYSQRLRASRQAAAHSAPMSASPPPPPGIPPAPR